MTRTKHDAPQNFPKHSGEIWERILIVVVYQPIVSDDPIDLCLGLLENFRVLDHTKQEGGQCRTGLNNRQFSASLGMQAEKYRQCPLQLSRIRSASLKDSVTEKTVLPPYSTPVILLISSSSIVSASLYGPVWLFIVSSRSAAMHCVAVPAA